MALENQLTAFLLLMPTTAAMGALVFFSRSCEIDCGDAGGKGLFFMWVATLPSAAAGTLIWLRTSTLLSPGLIHLTAGQLGQLVGFGFLALSLLPLGMAAVTIVEHGGALGEAMVIGGVGAMMALGSLLLIFSARSIRAQAEATRMGRPWGM